MSAVEIRKQRVAIVTSIHPDFDSRIWKHASSIAAKGLEVHLVCPWDVEDESVQDGVVFHPFRKVGKRWQRPFVIPYRVAGQLLPLLKRMDIIHFHDIDLLPWMGVIALFKNVVYDVHEKYAEEVLGKAWVPKLLRKPLYYLVLYGEKIFSRIIKNIVLVTPYQEDTFTNPRLNKQYVKNYATKKLLESVADDYKERQDAVIFIGSQHMNNGSFLFLDIAEKLHDIRPAVKFYASDRFGSQVFRDEYVARRKSKNLEAVVEFLPNVPPHELMGVLNKATIGINPNLRVGQQIKGIHTKVFEFMAAGIPMITSDLPHQIAVIEDSGAGLLADPDNFGTFVDAICQLVDDRETGYQIGKKGQQAFVEKYSWESQIPGLLGLYNKITPKLSPGSVEE